MDQKLYVWEKLKGSIGKERAKIVLLLYSLRNKRRAQQNLGVQAFIELRSLMLTEIYALLKQKATIIDDQKLHEIAIQLEISMLRNAQSIDEYSEIRSLQTRILRVTTVCDQSAFKSNIIESESTSIGNIPSQKRAFHAAEFATSLEIPHASVRVKRSKSI